MCSGSEAGSYLRRIDFVSLNSRLESNEEEEGMGRDCWESGPSPRSNASVTRLPALEREFIDYKTSMITDEDPLRELLSYQDLGFSHTLHALKAFGLKV